MEYISANYLSHCLIYPKFASFKKFSGLFFCSVITYKKKKKNFCSVIKFSDTHTNNVNIGGIQNVPFFGVQLIYLIV